jgi:hypothetical protein
MSTIRPTAIRPVLLLWMVAVASLCLAQAAVAGESIVFRGRDVGTFALPGPCGDGGLRVVIEGTGTATHLGRYTYEAEECFNPVTGAFSGVPIITAANGEQLFGTYTGQVAPTSDPAIVSYVEQMSISGGTGRFSDAWGTFEVVGEANLVDLVYHQSLAGIIANLGRK